MGSFQGLKEFLMNLPKGRALVTFVATSIVVCTISVLCNRLTLEVIDAGQWVGHTHRVLSEIHESISAVRLIEARVFRDLIADKRVCEFYSTVSHELRSPLTSIRGALGLMEGGKAGEMPAWLGINSG